MKKTVQTVVLAGGFGTRLLPITENKPKPLVRILDKTVLETVLEKAVGNVTVSAYYLWEKTANECRRIDRRITCKREMIPLGTAGAVKNCYDGMSDVILVLSGDAVFDFDLEEALEFHFETNSSVTVVTTHKKDPTSFGIVVSGKGGKIRHFTEKPDWERVVTGRINTGIYILNKEILDEIPDNIQYDFAKNLFPKLLSKGTELYSFEADGFWCDIGTPGEYLLCNSLAAKGKVRSVKNNDVDIAALIKSGIFADGGVYVGKGVTTGKNIKLGKGSVVCENVLLSDNCDLERCVVSKGTSVGAGSSISGSVVGERVIIGENCIVPDGCIIGDEAVISDGTVLKSSVKIGYREVVGKGDVSAVEYKNDKRLFVSRGVAVLDGKKNR